MGSDPNFDHRVTWVNSSRGFDLSNVQNLKFKNVLHFVQHQIERSKIAKFLLELIRSNIAR